MIYMPFFKNVFHQWLNYKYYNKSRTLTMIHVNNFNVNDFNFISTSTIICGLFPLQVGRNIESTKRYLIEL